MEEAAGQNQEELLSAVQQISELEAGLAGGYKPRPLKTVLLKQCLQRLMVVGAQVGHFFEGVSSLKLSARCMQPEGAVDGMQQENE